MAFKATIKIKDVVVTNSQYHDSMSEAAVDVITRFRQANITDWPEPLIIELYFKDTR